MNSGVTLRRRVRDSNDRSTFMLGQHFVRVGLLGSVGRFAAADRQRYARGTRVICRTHRGLEVGEVLSAADAGNDDPQRGS